MKILHVVASMNPSQGGVCQAIRGIVPELEKLGVHNEVVCLDEPEAPFLGNDTFPIHAVAPGKGPWCYNSKFIPWLLNHFHRFDAILVHGLWLYPSYAVRIALKRFAQNAIVSTDRINKVPKLYIMPHGMLDPYFQRAPGRRLKAIRNSIYWKCLEEKVVNEADGVLFTCEEELRLAREPFRPYRPMKEINVGFGIGSPPTFTPTMRQAFLKKCPELQNRSYLLFLGRLHEKKGVNLLIEAYAELINKPVVGKRASAAGNSASKEGTFSYNLDALPTLVIAGPGLETPFGIKMQALALTSRVLKENVLFLGMLTGDAKWGAFYGCEAFVLPSHQENFGIAVVEALACNKPVLISSQVNIWREIKTTGGGLVADNTLEGIRRLLKDWLKLTEQEKKAMGQQGQLTYNRHFAIGPASKRMREALQFSVYGVHD